MSNTTKASIATFGGGCFWCVEAVFQQLKGVQRVISGYMGGEASQADYRSVCSGLTEHVEVIQVHFDEQIISFTQLLEVFFATHDPTTLNRQGNDIGPQYRSVIFYHDEQQAEKAKQLIDQLQPEFKQGIVTAVEMAQPFYEAEAYHQNYFQENPNQPYCAVMIPPKLAKLKKYFSDVIDH